MIRIIKEAEIIHRVELSLNFDTSRTGGYSFPCDSTGKVDAEKIALNPAAIQNYERCISGEVKTIRPPYVQERTWTEHIPAIGECFCGGEVELSPDSEGLCYCHCGECYNSAGQHIRPRSEWEENY
jgi:hypothetical protein